MHSQNYGYDTVYEADRPVVESIQYKGVVRNRVTTNEVFSCISTEYAEAKQAVMDVLCRRGQTFVGEVVVVFDWV